MKHHQVHQIFQTILTHRKYYLTKNQTFFEDLANPELFEDQYEDIVNIDVHKQPIITVEGDNSEQDQLQSPISNKAEIPIRDSNWSRGSDSSISTTATRSLLNCSW